MPVSTEMMLHGRHERFAACSTRLEAILHAADATSGNHRQAQPMFYRLACPKYKDYWKLSVH